MKKFQKIMGMLAGTFAGLGIALIIVGIIMGGIKVVSSDVMNGNLSFEPGIMVGVNIIDDTEFNKMTSIEEKNTFDADSVNNINFEAEYGEFQILSWENSYYEIQCQNKQDNERIRYSLENGTLKIRIKGKKVVVFGDNVKAVLYVPKDDLIEDLAINMGAGELSCKDISKIQKLKVDIGAGEGKFSDISAEYVDMNVGAGEGDVDNAEFGECNFNVGVGELDVHGTISGSILVDCGIGDMDIKLTNSYEDFNYEVSVGLGEVYLGSDKYSGSVDNKVIDNETDRKITVRCGIGDVSIKYDQGLDF